MRARNPGTMDGIVYWNQGARRAHTVVYALDGYDVESSDAAFIARARTLVPDLVTALRAERERRTRRHWRRLN